MNKILTVEKIMLFKKHLLEEEKSVATIEKYAYDVSSFAKYTDGQKVTKELVIDNLNNKRKKLNQYLSDALYMQYEPGYLNMEQGGYNSMPQQTFSNIDKDFEI